MALLISFTVEPFRVLKERNIILQTDYSKRLSLGIKIGYSAAAIGDSCSYSFVGTYYLFFLTSIGGINPVAAGAIAAMGEILDSVWSPVIGYISDKTTLRYGRRRPFLLLTAFPLGLSIVLLFSCITADNTMKALYYGAMIIFFWTSFSTFFVPYLAFGAEITNDYSERTVLRSYAVVFNFIGLIVGVVTPVFIVDYLSKIGASPAEAWQKAALMVAFFTTLSILITWFCTRGKESFQYLSVHSTNKKKVFDRSLLLEMTKEYWQILKLKPVKYLVGGSIFFLIAGTMVNSDRMYFLTYNLGLESDAIFRVYLITLPAGVIFTPLIIKVSKVMDKRKAYVLGSSIAAIGVILFSLAGIDTLLDVIIFSFIFSLGSSCYWQLFPAMIYDICEVDELVSGQRREGIIMSVQSLAEALASAIAVQMLGVILGLSEFNGESAAQGKTATDWIAICFTIIPVVFVIAAIVMVAKYPISREKYNLVKSAISKKNNGEPYQTEELEDLI